LHPLLDPPLFSHLFFFTDLAPAQLYTLSLHDALPISPWPSNKCRECRPLAGSRAGSRIRGLGRAGGAGASPFQSDGCESDRAHRSEEHTSELQSPCNLVCRLLLEKKK